ncbi:MAG: hypothetical protein CMN97_01295 [Synechococcus sp. NAT40]|nr:hypothetical protein [Synechococcus sp. NAT40]
MERRLNQPTRGAERPYDLSNQSNKSLGHSFAPGFFFASIQSIQSTKPAKTRRLINNNSQDISN